MSIILKKIAGSKGFESSVDEIKNYIAESNSYKELTENLTDKSNKNILENYFTKAIEELSKNNLIEISNDSIRLTYNGKLKLIGGIDKSEENYMLSISPEEERAMKKILKLSRIDDDLKHAFEIIFSGSMFSRNELDKLDMNYVNLSNRKVTAEYKSKFINELLTNEIISKIKLSDEKDVDMLIKKKYSTV